ncbi:hypothetical protein Hamer_G007169 [Homarus americanus]|uniref:Uncharacterized protein n=1 Tax=Homarus americanus TaxID=6706 RepID=A0A8J5K5J3_HOMAM|nr:hypothetical protein Hamer_G007169 [Homarus americanus]
MKIMLVFLLVAVAVALPTADPDPQVLLYSHPYSLTLKTIDTKTPAATVPLTYTYPGLGYPATYSLPRGYLGYPYSYPYGYPYGWQVVANPAKEPAVEEA